jgi:hypothetical protein
VADHVDRFFRVDAKGWIFSPQFSSLFSEEKMSSTRTTSCKHSTKLNFFHEHFGHQFFRFFEVVIGMGDWRQTLPIVKLAPDPLITIRRKFIHWSFDTSGPKRGLKSSKYEGLCERSKSGWRSSSTRDHLKGLVELSSYRFHWEQLGESGKRAKK